jgi:hypothetical protein
MKTIKLFFFLGMLSFGLISCEPRTKVDVTAERTDETLDDAYTSSRTELEKTIDELRVSLDNRIRDTEAELESATDDTRVEINTRLDGYRERRSDLDRLADRIGDATAEGWADLEREAAEVVADIKEAIND